MKRIILIVIVVLIISLSLALAINSKNGDNIKFEVLYNGFITMNLMLEDLPPSGPIVFTSYEQWEEFGKKYIPKHYEPLYSYMTRERGIDFNENYLVFYSSVGAQTWYNKSFTSVEKVLVSDNRLKIVFSEVEEAKDIINGIYTADEQVEAANPGILILKVKKEDIPRDLVDIYQ
ncbi:MAG: hypothetical protein K0R84_2423, partial [Clostridia bacterium]|nr:hypothetical protein [Clostridia bacterium]